MKRKEKAAGQAVESTPAARTAPDRGAGNCSTAERLTCSVRDFAYMIGISYNTALDLCHSRNRPPGFRSGKTYRVISAEVPGWLREMSDRGLAI